MKQPEKGLSPGGRFMCRRWRHAWDKRVVGPEPAYVWTNLLKIADALMSFNVTRRWLICKWRRFIADEFRFQDELGGTLINW